MPLLYFAYTNVRSGPASYAWAILTTVINLFIICQHTMPHYTHEGAYVELGLGPAGMVVQHLVKRCNGVT